MVRASRGTKEGIVTVKSAAIWTGPAYVTRGLSMSVGVRGLNPFSQSVTGALPCFKLIIYETIESCFLQHVHVMFIFSLSLRYFLLVLILSFVRIKVRTGC